MSGTNHKKASLTPSPGPRVVLIEPQMGENIGAAARAMWNFELDRLHIVNPRDGWPNPKAQATASGAAPVMDNVVVRNSTQEALEDCHYVFATTARNRDLTKEVFTPEAAMQAAHEMIAEGKKVAVLFGPERAGLSNEDIVQANALISVPVNPVFASLNLAQCVLLLSYEWRKQKGSEAPRSMEMAGADFANHLEISNLQDRIVNELDDRGFFWPEDKAQSMKQTLKNMFTRLPLTNADVKTFHGIIRAFTRKPPE